MTDTGTGHRSRNKITEPAYAIDDEAEAFDAGKSEIS